MASIRKLPSGNWQAVWAVYLEGKRRQRRRNFATATAAREHAARMEMQELRGVGSVRITLAAYLAEWLDTKEKEVGPNTMAGYRRWVEHALRGAVAAMPIDRIAPRDLEQLYNHLLATPGGRRSPLSAVSVRHVAAVLGNVFADAKRHKLIADNPAPDAKRPRGQSPRVAAPNAAQVAALLDDLARHNPSLTDLAILLISTGCRRSEALDLRWRDVDFVAGSVVIQQVVIEHDGQWSIREGTKSIAGQRTLRLPAVAIEALRRQQARAAAARLKLGRYWHDHDLVFPDEASGGPRAPAAITRAFSRATVRVAKLPCGWPEDASPVHSLRHAAATMALAAGVDIGTVSQRLGHSWAAVTLRIYISGTADRDAAAGDAMAAAITVKPRPA